MLTETTQKEILKSKFIWCTHSTDHSTDQNWSKWICVQMKNSFAKVHSGKFSDRSLKDDITL